MHNIQYNNISYSFTEGSVVMAILLPVASSAGSVIAASLLHVEILAHSCSS